MALSSAKRARVNSGGEAGGRAHQKVRCEMGSNLSGDISEVKFLTIAEVASVMRVSKMTVYRLVHGGELPAVRVGESAGPVPRQDHATTDVSRSGRSSSAGTR